MLHDLKKNEHIKYLLEISLDKIVVYVIPRQCDNTEKWVAWSSDPCLAENYRNLEFKQEWSHWIWLGTYESGCK